MTTLSTARSTRRRDGSDYSYPVAAGAKIFAGSQVTLSATAFARNGQQGGTRVVGVATETVDNTGGADGAKNVPVSRGIFLFLNSAAADLITRAHIGMDCFLVDDETVALTNAASTRVVAGRVADIEVVGATTMVWVKNEVT